jgi:hypothetical protein
LDVAKQEEIKSDNIDRTQVICNERGTSYYTTFKDLAIVKYTILAKEQYRFSAMAIVRNYSIKGY